METVQVAAEDIFVRLLKARRIVTNCYTAPPESSYLLTYFQLELRSILQLVACSGHRLLYTLCLNKKRATLFFK